MNILLASVAFVPATLLPASAAARVRDASQSRDMSADALPAPVPITDGVSKRSKDKTAHPYTQRQPDWKETNAEHFQRSNSAADTASEIVVTGELIARPIQRNPGSISVVTGEQIDGAAQVDLYDVARALPNVSSGPGDRGFTIRGINQTGATGLMTPGFTIATIVDDVPMASGGESQGLGPYGGWDLDRVEVLRGPQSTQQGPNSLAGAVLIKTRDPVLNSYEGAARIGAYSYGGNRESIAGNLPFGDVAALRLSYDRATDHGFIYSPNLDGKKYAPNRLETIRAKFLFQPTDDFRILATVNRTNNRQGTPVVDEAFGLDARTILSNYPALVNTRTTYGSVVADWQVAPRVGLTSVTSYLRADTQRKNDLDYTTQNYYLDIAYHDRNWRQEVRLHYTGEDIQAVVGAYYAEQRDRSPGIATYALSNFFPGAPGTVILDNYDAFNIENKAVFGELDWQVLPQLTITVGARYDSESRHTSSLLALSTDPKLPIQLPSSDDDTRASYSAFLPKVAAVWNIVPDINLGVSYQRGYRAGGFSRSTISGAGGVFDPEYLDNFELAFRSQFFDRRLTINANAFRGTYRDQQVPVSGPTGNPQDYYYANAGKSRITGFELVAEGRPDATLSLHASVGYTKTNFLTFFDASTGNDYQGKQFVFAPRWTGSAGFAWTLFTPLSLSGNVTYRGAAYGDVSNSASNRMDPATLADARLTYGGTFSNDVKWHAAIYGRNLTNKIYRTLRYNAANPAAYFIGDPRTIGIEVGVEF